jgi:hypothetical protein
VSVVEHGLEGVVAKRLGEPYVLRLLHFVDQHSSGEIAMPEIVTADEQARRHYLVNSLMEEASQQLPRAAVPARDR